MGCHWMVNFKIDLSHYWHSPAEKKWQPPVECQKWIFFVSVFEQEDEATGFSPYLRHSKRYRHGLKGEKAM